MKTAQKILAPDNNKGRGVATFLGKIWKSCNITLRLLKVLYGLCCHLWMRKLDHEDDWWITYGSTQNERTMTDSPVIIDNKENNW